MKHLVFLINPHSGVDRNKQITDALNRGLDFQQFTYEIQYTQYEKHGIELSKAAALKGAYAVVAVGGDGTVNDVITGLQGTNTALAIIPKGSGNGVAHTLGIPLDIHKALAIINQKKWKEVDVASANEHLFISNAGVGFDAMIIEKFRASKKRGLLSYCYHIFQSIWNYSSPKWHIQIDDTSLHSHAFMINVANGTHLGYGFVIAHDAEVDDGLLNVTFIKKIPTLVAAELGFRMLLRTVHKSKYVLYIKAKNILITAPDLHQMQTDGDAHSVVESLHIRIVGKQKVLVP